MVDGAAFEAGDVVGEELEGDGGGKDGGVERAGGHGDVVSDGGDGFLVSFGDDAEDAGIAGLTFGDVAEGFVFAGTIVAKGDDGEVFFKEGDGAVFEFGGVVAFGMDVGNLLELERSFECDRVEVASSDEEG